MWALRTLTIVEMRSLALGVLASSLVVVSLGLGVGSFGLSGLGLEFRDDSSHHRFQGFLGSRQRFSWLFLFFGVHLGGEGRPGLIHGVACVEALDAVALLVPCLADAKMLRVGLSVSQTWAGC